MNRRMAPLDAASTTTNPSMMFVAPAAVIAGGVIAAAAFWGMNTSTATVSDQEQEPTHPFHLWGKKVHLSITPDQMASPHREAMEALMPTCQHGWFPSSHQGEQLHYRKFLPKKQPPTALIVFHHGIQDHSGKAFVTKDGRKLSTALLVDELVDKQGYALYCMDQLGHGYSEGRRMYMPSYKDCATDLANFAILASKELPDLPFFVSGMSMGGNLALHAAVQLQEQSSIIKNFQGLILLCAALKGDLPPPPILYLLRDVLAPRYPTWCPFFMPNPVSPDRIWRDKEALEFNTNAEYKAIGLEAAGDPMLLGTAVQCLNGLDDATNTELAKVTVPFVAIHGLEDHAVPVESMDILESKVGTRKEDQSVVRMTNPYHDLLCDPEAEQVMEHAVAFVKKRLGKK